MNRLEMDYNTVFLVMDSWENLRRKEGYPVSAGLRLFEIMFAQNPKAMALFGLRDIEPTQEHMKTNSHFVAHAELLMTMMDRSLQMLGPDAELLHEILTDLGKKHERMGVSVELFPLMGDGLIQTIKEALGSAWSPEMEQAWKDVYNAMMLTMMEAMNNDKIVVDSWAKLKEKSSFEKIGVLLFETMFRNCPETKTLWGFPIDANIDGMLDSRRFKIHASFFVEMLDTSIEMVEAEKLEENMNRLGVLHNSYGVKAEYFDIMKDALFLAFETLLKEEWTIEAQQAWDLVFEKMASQMIAAMEKAGKQ